MRLSPVTSVLHGESSARPLFCANQPGQLRLVFGHAQTVNGASRWLPSLGVIAVFASEAHTVDTYTLHSRLPEDSIASLTPILSVRRYREKRKRRTFEKTIRYESRKAYAEVRPRIKARPWLDHQRITLSRLFRPLKIVPG